MQSLTASKRVAANLKFLRKTKNLSQQQLSKISGLPKSTINHIESGSGKPSVDAVEALANAFSISIDELMSSPSREIETKSASEMPLVKEIKGVVTLRRILPDPFGGIAYYFGEFLQQGSLPGVIQKSGGKKLIFCTEGEIQVQLAGDVRVIEKGGACLFQGDIAHAIQNTKQRPACFFKIHIFKV